jgi:hypothetical protein
MSSRLQDITDVIDSIKALKETKNNFYRDNEANYYHRILSLIEFFQGLKESTVEKNVEFFGQNLHVINDFKDLFLELYDDPNYRKNSAKKTNFYKTIDTLLEFTSSFPKTIKPIEEGIAIELEELRESIKEATKELEESKKEFFDSKRAIEEENRLHSSQKYWSNKKQSHQKRSIVLSIVFSILVTILVYITNQNISTINSIYLKESNSTKVVDTQKLKSSKSIKYIIIESLESLLILSLFIWLSRIILKIIFSNLHLKEEAYEKETMIVTYLALIKEGGGLSESDRSLILEAIFRPSTNGLIKDESSVTLLDVANIFKGKGA